MHGNQEVHVERVDTHAAIQIDIGRGKEVLDFLDVESGFLLDFATHSLFYRFAHVDETTRQVERPLGRFLSTSHHQHLLLVVDNKSSRSRTGVCIIRKPAVLTLLAFEVVDLKMTAATDRTIFELF